MTTEIEVPFIENFDNLKKSLIKSEPEQLKIETDPKELPIQYRDTTNNEEDIICFIGEDRGEDGAEPHNGKYIALLENRTTNERKMLQLENLEHVNEYRAQLMVSGWRMIKRPKVNVINEMKGKAKHARREKREGEKRDSKLTKQKEKRDRLKIQRKEKLREELAKRKAYAEKLKRNKGKEAA